ncbi:hypothetical protein Tco_1280665, partial [Tanacetum coccineum]
MVINSPCLTHNKELAIPGQMETSKESSNPLMANSLPKTILPSKLVGNKAVHKELGDRMERAATTTSSLKAEELVQSNDPPLSRAYTLGSEEDSMKLKELMAPCTKLSEIERF